MRQDDCIDPTCYHAKVETHVAKTVAAKPKLVQISTAYGRQEEGSQRVRFNGDIPNLSTKELQLPTR